VTKSELLEKIKAVCMWCRQEKPLHYRVDTNEYTHQWNEKSAIDSVIVNHRMCDADELRKKYRSILEDGRPADCT